MKGIRPQRVAELVHRELAVLLRTDIKDPRVGDVSITHIQVTGDLRQARVYVTSLGGGGDDKQMLRGLQSAARFLRGRVGRALKLRHAPELEFRLDEGLVDVDGNVAPGGWSSMFHTLPPPIDIPSEAECACHQGSSRGGPVGSVLLLIGLGLGRRRRGLDPANPRS